jgi:hypothetical protein
VIQLYDPFTINVKLKEITQKWYISSNFLKYLLCNCLLEFHLVFTTKLGIPYQVRYFDYYGPVL